MLARICLILGALLGGSAVAIGAYHAHGLAKFLERQSLEPAVMERRMENCSTAVKYQMFHAVTLVALAALATQFPAPRRLAAAATLFVLGVAGFSGGLYLIVFAGNAVHWAIVPVGGMTLIVAWLTLASAGLGSQK
jgi:uncharacterized membrane protein YgdD (TMEM256/DUF423 family)